jgi:SAM-dependent methyltransferase
VYRFLHQQRESERIRQLLLEFYEKRPAYYGMDDNRKVWICEYADNVLHYAEGRKKVLDFGSGSWLSPLELARRGLDVVGIDLFSEQDLRRFKEQIGSQPGVSLERYSGGATLPFADGSFEVIASLCVFEHLLNVEKVLSEMKRVLAPGGRVIIQGPNWGGPNNPIRALIVLLTGGRRYFQFERIPEAFLGLLLSSIYPPLVALSRKALFLYIYPRLSNGEISFEVSDDEAVHLCIPTSFKRWFALNGFRLIGYNSRVGRTTISRIFNSVFPMYSTTNLIVAQRES